MIEPRRGEKPTSNCIRTARYFETDKGWFLQTREGIHVGPYPTSFDAQLASSLLISRLAQLDEEEIPAQTIHSFLRDPAYGPKPIRSTTSANCEASSKMHVEVCNSEHSHAIGNALLSKLVNSWRALSNLPIMRR